MTKPPSVSLPRVLLHLEGLAVAVLATYAFRRTDASWWLYNLFFLAPDLSMIGYLAGPKIGAYAYDAAHTYLVPAALIGLGLTAWPAVLPYGLVWAAHIGLDRCMNYGLKYATSFKDQHMSRV